MARFLLATLRIDMDIRAVLRQLARKRPLFHSEADFQHALAWELQSIYPNAHVRLEFRPFPEERFYLDIWWTDRQYSVAIELKYLTRLLDVTVEGERFVLKNQAAQDISRYDIVKDIVRVERVVRSISASQGFVIVLTNDAGYWKESLRLSTVDAAFRLHHGRVLKGTLAWSPLAGAGTIAKRDLPLSLEGTYELTWEDFSRMGGEPGQRFRYMLAEVRS